MKNKITVINGGDGDGGGGGYQQHVNSLGLAVNAAAAVVVSDDGNR